MLPWNVALTVSPTACSTAEVLWSEYLKMSLKVLNEFGVRMGFSTSAVNSCHA